MKRSIGDRIFDTVNTVFLIIVSISTLYPFWHELCMSLSSPEKAALGGLFTVPREFTLAAYKSVLGTNYIWTAYSNSIFTTFFHTLLGLLFTAAIAYSISKKAVPGGKQVMALILFTMLFGGGMIPSYLLVKQLGLINSLWALIIPALISPFNVIIMKNFFSSIPAELEESAFMDGANPIVIFFRIILPLSKPVLATVSLWIAVGTWNNFFGALLYLNERKLMTLPLVLRDIINGQIQAQTIGEIRETTPDTIIGATIIVSIAPILMLYPFLQKYFVKGVMIGSVKG